MTTGPGPAATQAGSTIRAFEELQKRRFDAMDAKKWEGFLLVMRTYGSLMLRGIERSIENGRSAYYPSTIAGFALKCDAVFGQGLGMYDHEMMNVWLYANDLAHFLRAERGGMITW